MSEEIEFSKLREKIQQLEIIVARIDEREIAAKDALAVANETLKAYKATANEWRQENIDQRGLYPTDDKVRGWIDALSVRMNSIENKRAELSGAWAAIVFIMPFVTGILVGLVMHFWK